MSWVAVGVGVGGAVIGYVGQNQTNKANAKAAKSGGRVDVTTTRTGDPRADPYRDAGMQAAYNALFPGQPLPSPPPPPPPGPPRPGGLRVGGPQDDGGNGQYTPIASPSTAPGYRVNKQGKTVRVRNPATPGGGVTAKPAAKPFAGMSDETAAIREDMMGLDEQNAPMLDEAEAFATDTLRGDTRNPLIGRATAAADEISADPGLQEYIDFLKGGAGGGAAKGDRKVNLGTVNAAYASGGGGFGGMAGGGPAGYGSATGTDAALRKLVAGELPPGWQEAEDAISRKVNEGRAANIRELRARAVGSSFYGGDLYKDLETGAIAKGDQEMADALAAKRYDAFANALGLGTQYDLGIADIGSRERTAAANAAAASGAAGADAASREKLAMAGMWGEALGMGQQGRSGRAAALGDLAGLTSEDQRFAFGGVNDLAGSRRADLGAAGELSLGADANRNAFRASQNQLAGVRAGVNLGRDELGFAREQFYDPLGRTAKFADIINGFYGGYGSETTVGQDQRGAGGGGYSSPWGAAMTGAALGGQVGSAYGNSRRQAPPSGAGGGGGW